MNGETRLLDLAVKAAVTAGIQILDVYGREFEIEWKKDKSPLTLADRLAHSAISEILSEGGYPILSEEGKDIPYGSRKNWDRFWLVDPLDGTKEFIKRNGEFTVNIALIEKGIPVMGVILVPVTGMIYFASCSQGAFRSKIILSEGIDFRNLKADPLPLKAQKYQRPYRVVCSRSHISPETEEFIEVIRESHPDLEYISAGSSLKLCLVAEGYADLYPRFGPTMEWDTAAGQAIVEISGGWVKTAEDGIPLRYNKENLLNPWFISGRE